MKRVAFGELFEVLIPLRFITLDERTGEISPCGTYNEWTNEISPCGRNDGRFARKNGVR